MNKSLAAKIGEITAFSRASGLIYKKARKVLTPVFNKKEIGRFIEENNTYTRELEKFARDNEILWMSDAKQEESMHRLQRMGDIYLNDDWEKGEEVLEWLGFIEGSATVHFSLVEDLAKNAKHKRLHRTAKKGTAFHKTMLGKIASAIKQMPTTI